MAEVAKKITQIGTAEQDFGQNQDLEPWLRQKNESAAWYMRFKRYLELGPKRSLRKALAAEPDTQKATKGTNKKSQATGKLSDMSIPGAWKRASKLWRWVERAERYDLAQAGREADRMREFAATQKFSSKSYRLAQLNYCAICLQKVLESQMSITDKFLPTYLAAIARYQSVMRDIEILMQGSNIDSDLIEANAMFEVSKEVINQKYGRKMEKSTLLEKIDLETERRKEINELMKRKSF